MLSFSFLKFADMDSEYVVNVTAFDYKMSFGRPEIIILARNSKSIASQICLSRSLGPDHSHTYKGFKF